MLDCGKRGTGVSEPKRVTDWIDAQRRLRRTNRAGDEGCMLIRDRAGADGQEDRGERDVRRERERGGR